MRPTLRTMALASFLAFGSVLGLGSSSAKAQGFGHHHHGGGYRGGYSRGYGGGYYGGGYAVPSYSYYGNGGHDYQPHGHTAQTPYGGYSYYGNGAHDFVPHGHVQTPYGITGYNGGYPYTQSYSPPTPYMPW